MSGVGETTEIQLVLDFPMNNKALYNFYGSSYVK